MSLAETLHPVARWNAWANGQVMETLRTSGGQPAAALAAFQHVLAAELTWLRRMGGESDANLPLWGPPDLGQCGRWLEEAGRLVALVASLDERERSRSFTYRNSSGREFTDALEPVLLHVFLHSSQYRGEAAGLLNAAGHRVPDLDFIFWRRQQAPA